VKDYIEWAIMFTITTAVGWMTWSARQEKISVLKWRKDVDDTLVNLTQRLALAEQQAENESQNRQQNDTALANTLEGLTATLQTQSNKMETQHTGITETLTEIKVTLATLKAQQ